MEDQGQGERPADDDDLEQVPAEIADQIPEVAYDSITERVMLLAG
ncbi:MAG: hypothetical protein AAF416_20985 [Pseudomonadota bacterium]